MTKEREKLCVEWGSKASKRASETREQALHRREQNRTYLACAEGSALQCCSLEMVTFNSSLLETMLYLLLHVTDDKCYVLESYDRDKDRDIVREDPDYRYSYSTYLW